MSPRQRKPAIYQEGSFNNLSRPPEVVALEADTQNITTSPEVAALQARHEQDDRPPRETFSLRMKRRIGNGIGRLIVATQDATEKFAMEGERVYGDPHKRLNQSQESDRPRNIAVIYETDTSNREGVYAHKSSYWGRGIVYESGPPTYGRRYTLPAEYPLVRSSDCFLNLTIPTTSQERLLPVLKLGKQLRSEMRGVVRDAAMWDPRSVDIQLSQAGDEYWEQGYSEQFHGFLGQCVMEKYGVEAVIEPWPRTDQ